jgi:hypothetical protein
MALVPERDTVYVAVLDAMRGEGCGLCRLAEQRVKAYLECLMDEMVNAPSFREHWRASRGFCRRHGWLLAAAPHALGLAILYADLFDYFGEKLFSPPTGGCGCPACQVEGQVVEKFRHVLVRHWPDAELQHAVIASDGFCVPHLHGILAGIGSREIRNALMAASGRRLKALAERLHEQIRSFDYRYAEDPVGKEVADAWRAAMALVIGRGDPGP